MLNILILLLTGCHPDSDKLSIMEEDIQSENTASSIKDVTNTNSGKELTLVREQPDKETFHIDIGRLPILMSYLDQTEDSELEISRFRSNYMFTHNHKDYFLVSYNCGTKPCNQLLVELDQDEIKSFEVSESSFLQGVKLNEGHSVFLFGRNEGTEVVRNHVVIFNLDEFRKVLPPEQLRVLESFEYPILSGWITNLEWILPTWKS